MCFSQTGKMCVPTAMSNLVLIITNGEIVIDPTVFAEAIDVAGGIKNHDWSVKGLPANEQTGSIMATAFKSVTGIDAVVLNPDTKSTFSASNYYAGEAQKGGAVLMPISVFKETPPPQYHATVLYESGGEYDYGIVDSRGSDKGSHFDSPMLGISGKVNPSLPGLALPSVKSTDFPSMYHASP